MSFESKGLACVLLTLALAGFVGVARASPTSKRACVEASTAGQTARDEGDLVAAKELLLTCASDDCPRVVRKSCGQWLADVEQRIPSVVVRVRDAQGADVTDAELQIDGESRQLDGRSLALNPGPHTLLVTGASGQATELKVLMAEQETSRLISVQLPGDAEKPAVEVAAVQLEDSAGGALSTEPRRARRAFKLPVGAWVLGGVGLAGLAGFAYFAVSARRELDDLKRECSPTCASEQTADGRRSALTANISLGVGAAALLGSGAWTFVAWTKDQHGDHGLVTVVPTRDGVLAGYRRRF